MKKNNMVRLISYVTKEQKKGLEKFAKSKGVTSSDVVRSLLVKIN